MTGTRLGQVPIVASWMQYGVETGTVAYLNSAYSCALAAHGDCVWSPGAYWFQVLPGCSQGKPRTRHGILGGG